MENSNSAECLNNQIIEVAKQMFLEYGYKNTNMSDIATNIGINRTALHYYYNTKEKLFQAVFGTIIATFLPKIQDILLFIFALILISYPIKNGIELDLSRHKYRRFHSFFSFSISFSASRVNSME